MLARNAERKLADQGGPLIRFDEQNQCIREGCRDKLVWMGVNLKIGRTTAFENCGIGMNCLVTTHSRDKDALVQRAFLQGQGSISRATARRLAAAVDYTLLATDAGGDAIGTAKRAPL